MEQRQTKYVIRYFSKTLGQQLLQHKEREKEKFLNRIDVNKVEIENNKMNGFSLCTQFWKNMSILATKWPSKKWGEVQKQIIQACFETILPYFFGWDNYQKSERLILKKLGIEKRSNEVFIATGRRMGKSEIMAATLSVVIYLIPNISILIFSPVSRASNSLSEKILDYFEMLPGAKKMVESKNEERIIIKGTSQRDRRSLFSFPATVKGLRGQGGNILVLEEAAHCDREMYEQVIIPIWGVSGTIMLAITTIDPNDPLNYFTELMNWKKSNGECRFNVKHFSLVCKECKEKKDFNNRACPHNLHLLPEWKSEEKQELITEMLKGRKDLQMTEILGEAATEENIVFNNDKIQCILNKNKIYIPTHEISHYFLAVDPNGGGIGSDMAIMGGFVKDGVLAICGMESEPCKTIQEMKDLLVNHLKESYSKFPFLQNSQVVFMPESNLGNESQYMWDYLQTFQPKPFLFQCGPSHKIGVYTDRTTKPNMIYDLQKLVEDQRISFCETVVCVGNVMNPKRDKYPSYIIDEWSSQMKRFKRIVSHSKTDLDYVRIRFSGKGENGSNPLKDDMVMATAMLFYFRNMFVLTQSKKRTFSNI